MSATYVPYSKTAPKTTHLPTLKAELERVREVHGRRSSQALEAYLRYSHAAASQGRPLDALRSYVEDEEERFFALTIAGPDGHTYWDGPRQFVRNDRARRSPIRWWWEHRNGALRPGDTITAMCGERNCITPEHCEKEDRSARNQLWTDAQLIGHLQVIAIRLGRTPNSMDVRDGSGPSQRLYHRRFGGWAQACRAAGLEYVSVSATPRSCLAALRLARRIAGHWPSYDQFRFRPDIQSALVEAELPRTPNTIRRYLGATWAECLRKAGDRS